jgi:hypothetical protein
MTTLFLHDGGICAFILASGADMCLFRPREQIKDTSDKAAAPERGNKKPNSFGETEQFSFSVFTPFLLR